MPYARYRRTYGRRRTRRRPRQIRGKLSTAGPVSNLRYYDIFGSWFPKDWTNSTGFSPDDYYDWTKFTASTGSLLTRPVAIQQTMLPMSVGTGYGTIREQNYKLHAVHTRFRLSEFGRTSVMSNPGTQSTDNVRPSNAVRIVLFFDTAGYGSVVTESDPTALFGNYNDTGWPRDLCFKELFRDAERFKIIADKRISLPNRLVGPFQRPGETNLLYFNSDGYHRYVDFHWKAPRPVLVRVNDVENAATSVGNLQLYCCAVQVLAWQPGSAMEYKPQILGATRVVFSNV